MCGGDRLDFGLRVSACECSKMPADCSTPPSAAMWFIAAPDAARSDGSSGRRPSVRPLRSRDRLRGVADARTSERRHMLTAACGRVLPHGNRIGGSTSSGLDRQYATHFGQMTFSKPVSQQNSVPANQSAHERPLASPPNRPQAGHDETFTCSGALTSERSFHLANRTPIRSGVLRILPAADRISGSRRPALRLSRRVRVTTRIVSATQHFHAHVAAYTTNSQGCGISPFLPQSFVGYTAADWRELPLVKTPWRNGVQPGKGRSFSR